MHDINCCDYYVDPIPLIGLHLDAVMPGQLLFSWSSAANNCPSLKYMVISSCGNCSNPFNTTTTTAICSVEVSIEPTMCWFAVKSVVCGEIVSGWSNLTVNRLKGT